MTLVNERFVDYQFDEPGPQEHRTDQYDLDQEGGQQEMAHRPEQRQQTAEHAPIEALLRKCLFELYVGHRGLAAHRISHVRSP